jgi:REP element-mobilizing transposase RayT
MRSSRIKMEGSGCYHCMSRVVDRRMIFGDDEKEHFRRLMRRCEAFCGVNVLTYAILGNH